MEPGELLRKTRERLGLTIRQVEAASLKLAEKYANPDYGISLSRLSDIETKGVVPNIFKLYSLAAIYHVDIRKLLGLYGIDLGNLPSDHQLLMPPRTHRITGLDYIDSAKVPVRLDPGFDPKSTSNGMGSGADDVSEPVQYSRILVWLCRLGRLDHVPTGTTRISGADR